MREAFLLSRVTKERRKLVELCEDRTLPFGEKTADSQRALNMELIKEKARGPKPSNLYDRSTGITG